MFLKFLLSTQQIVDKDTTQIKEPAVVIKETIETLINTPTDELISSGINALARFGLKIFAALLILILGIWIIKLTKLCLKKLFLRKAIDPSLGSFLISFSKVFFSIILVLTIISVLGINTASIVAILAGSGLAIGMALSGTLQNLAGGVMILIFKPFRVGHFIEAQGYNGTVKSIEMTTTQITTPDNKTIILPNGSLSNGIINNFTASGIRRCDWNISISYGDDFNIAKETIMDILNQNDLVLKTPEEPFIAISNLADSGIIITVRAWVKSCDYWNLFFTINEQIYIELPKSGVRFPFPQIDVHITNNND